MNISKAPVSMMRLISFIMTKEVNQEICDKCESCVKVYLSMVNKFDNDLNSEETECKPIWVKKSNYMSLLNLPKQMNLFGPLRRYWEGSYRGEALVQELKPLIKTGLTTNWQEQILQSKIFGQIPKRHIR